MASFLERRLTLHTSRSERCAIFKHHNLTISAIDLTSCSGSCECFNFSLRMFPGRGLLHHLIDVTGTMGGRAKFAGLDEVTKEAGRGVYAVPMRKRFAQRAAHAGDRGVPVCPPGKDLG